MRAFGAVRGLLVAVLGMVLVLPVGAVPSVGAAAAARGGRVGSVAALPAGQAADPLGPIVAPQPPLPVLSRLLTRDPVYYVTIDDGTVADPDVLRLVRRHRIPVTVFLTAAVIGGRAGFFRDVASYGGSVQNHTARHARLDLTTTDVAAEVCGIQDRYQRLFGARPWLLRPPGGFGPEDPRVHRVVAGCGIAAVLLWDVVVERGRMSYQHQPLRAGDVVLLHFTPSLAADLALLLRTGRRLGLRPAALPDPLVGAPVGAGSLRSG